MKVKNLCRLVVGVSVIILLFFIFIRVCQRFERFKNRKDDLSGRPPSAVAHKKSKKKGSVSDNQRIVDIWKKGEFTKIEIDYINSFASVMRNVGPETRFKFVIHAIFKNERLFMEEWLNWHLFCIEGVDHIYLYQNGQDVPTKKLIEPFIFMGLVTLVKYNHIRKEGEGQFIQPQHLAKNHCINVFGKEFEWILHIDIDEFVVLSRGIHTLDQLFVLYGNSDQILIPRTNFGSNGHRKHQPSVLLAYTKKESTPSNVKSIAKARNIKDCLQSSCHRWKMKEGSKTVKCSPLYFNLNHYYTKSLEDYLVRLSNGKGEGTGSRKSTVRDWAQKNENMNAVEDLVAFDQYKRCRSPPRA